LKYYPTLIGTPEKENLVTTNYFKNSEFQPTISTQKWQSYYYYAHNLSFLISLHLLLNHLLHLLIALSSFIFFSQSLSLFLYYIPKSKIYVMKELVSYLVQRIQQLLVSFKKLESRQQL